MEYTHGSKRKAVLEALRHKAMSAHEVYEHFLPDITYAYIRTMLYKLHSTGYLEICGTGQLTISPSGGHREYYIYRTAGSKVQPPEHPVRIQKEVSVGFRIPKQVRTRPKGSKGRIPKKVLTDAVMTADERRSMILQSNPLFQMYA